jgi:hypothetical protein
MRAGNRAVAGAVQAVQREAEEDLTTVGQSEELEGAAGTKPLAVQRKASQFAKVNLTEGAVSVVKKSGADIGAAHGRPVAVGWTTPAYDIQPAADIGPNMASLDTSVSFTMELASDYTGARGQVLRDHEQGHVRIGMLRARQHLDRELHDALAALPRPYTRTGLQGAISAAATAFSNGERTDSQTYDDSDYPRMTRAYAGARTSMATLGTATPVLQQLIDALRSFVMQPAERIGGAAAGVVSAKAACSQDDIDTLQYNPEFAGVVTQAINHANTLEQAGSVPEGSRQDLDHAQQAMTQLRFSSQRAVRKAIGR